MKRVVFLTALFTWLCAPSALAHSLHVFAQYDGRTVSGKAYYSDMTWLKRGLESGDINQCNTFNN